MAKGFDTTWNERALQGWNEWKRICSICGCSPEVKKLLAKEVRNAFRKKLCRCLGVTEAASVMAEHDDLPEFWAHEFDMGIIEKRDDEKAPKNYKDEVWKDIAESEDPPLKIIRGELIGPVGIINAIANRFLKFNHEQLWAKVDFKQSDDNTGKPSQGRRLVSLNQALDNDEEGSRTLEDGLEGGDGNSLARVQADEREVIAAEIRNLFEPRDMALLLAYISRKAIYQTAVLDFVQLQKSSAFERLNKKILPRLCHDVSEECREALTARGGATLLIKILIELLKPEKGATEFLSYVQQEEK